MSPRRAAAIAAAFGDAGVPPFFFKGIALLGRFYRLDDRRLDDVDLMVPVQQRNSALAVLHAHGYAELSDAEVWGPASQRPGATMYRVDPTTGEQDERAPLLDVHWGLEPVSAMLPADGITLPSAVWAAVAIPLWLAFFSGQSQLPTALPPVVWHVHEMVFGFAAATVAVAVLERRFTYDRTRRGPLVLAPAAPALTGVLLAVARIAGETAPLLLTSFGNFGYFQGVGSPVQSLPLNVYTLSSYPYPTWIAMAWSSALVLVVLMLGLSVAARLLLRPRFRERRIGA